MHRRWRALPRRLPVPRGYAKSPPHNAVRRSTENPMQERIPAWRQIMGLEALFAWRQAPRIGVGDAEKFERLHEGGCERFRATGDLQLAIRWAGGKDASSLAG